MRKHWCCYCIVKVLIKKICKNIWIHFNNFWTNVSFLTRLCRICFISCKISSQDTLPKIKLLFLLIPAIALILGCFLYFSMAFKTGSFMLFTLHRISPLTVILRFLTTLVKKSLNISVILPLSEITSSSLKFVTKVYRKPTFSGVYTHFDSFLPLVYKAGTIYTLPYWCLKICSNWKKFCEELNFLRHVFLKNRYPLSFIDKCFEMVMNKLVIKRPQVTTVERKTLFLSLTYLGDISLQTRTKLRKSLKGILNCFKFQIIFKGQRKLANVFRFKDCLPFDLVSGVVYKYTRGRCNSSYYG